MQMVQPFIFEHRASRTQCGNDKASKMLILTSGFIAWSFVNLATSLIFLQMIWRGFDLCTCNLFGIELFFSETYSIGSNTDWSKFSFGWKMLVPTFWKAGAAVTRLVCITHPHEFVFLRTYLNNMPIFPDNLQEGNRRGLSISQSNAVQSITFNSIHLNFQRSAKEEHLLIMNSEPSSSSSRTSARRCALRDSWRWERTSPPHSCLSFHLCFPQALRTEFLQ